MARDAQYQGKQALVPAEGLLGQLAAGQGRGEGQVQLQQEEGDRLKKENDKRLRLTESKI